MLSVDHRGETRRSSMGAPKPYRFHMQPLIIVGQLSHKTVSRLIGNSEAPITVLASDSQLPIAKAGEPYMVRGFNDERIHQAVLTVNVGSIGTQQAPRLPTQDSPLADPVLSPVLSKTVGLLT